MKRTLITRLSLLTAMMVSTAIAASSTTTVQSTTQKADIVKNIDVFTSIYKALHINYVDSIDSRKAIRNAIDYMLDQLDPYCEYIPVEEQEEFRSVATGEYGGVGSTIIQRDKKVYFSEPFEGSPSAKAGIRPGDLILSVDGVSTEGKDYAAVSDMLRGQAGTPVKVEVRRPYVADSLLTFNFMREKIVRPSVPYYGIVTPGVGYIKLTGFTDKSYNEVRSALIDMKRTGNITSLILDLRDNGGGLLDEAVKILGLFVDKNTLVLQTKGKSQLSEKSFRTTMSPVDTSIRLAVLINGNSASASEITAGALQDLDRAVVIGRRSYGKGLVQSTVKLPYEDMLKVTIAKYYIPSGRLIQAIDYSRRNDDGSVARMPDSLTTVFHTANGREVRDGGGITPDVKVELPESNRLLYNLATQYWIFDFANKYRASHPSISPAEEFEVTDEIFDDFKAFINPEKIEYDRPMEKWMDALKEAVKSEGYMNDSISTRLEELSGMLKHDLNRDLDFHRQQIVEYLGPEIVERYYFDRGEIIESLKSDRDKAKAVEILVNKEKYREILSPKK